MASQYYSISENLLLNEDGIFSYEASTRRDTPQTQKAKWLGGELRTLVLAASSNASWNSPNIPALSATSVTLNAYLIAPLTGFSVLGS